MFLSDRTMKLLIESGLPTDKLVELMQSLRADEEAATPVRSTGAERQRRYRERHNRNEASPGVTVVTSDAPLPSKEVSPAPLQETQPTPPPSPPKGGSSPTRFSPTKAELDAIWEGTPRLGRERSSRKDLERSMMAAMRRGHDPADVKRGLELAYASPSFAGDHAKGVHRLIENDRWQSFTEAIVALNPAMDPAREAEIRRRMIELAEQRAAANA